MKTIVIGVSVALLCLALTGDAEAQGRRRESVPRWARFLDANARALDRQARPLTRPQPSSRVPNYYRYSTDQRRNHRGRGR